MRFRRFPIPSLVDLEHVLAEQLGPRLAQLKADWAAYGPLIERYQVVDDGGAVHFDVILFRGEDGPVFRAGTADFVATFSQGSISECDDEDLAQTLETALRAFRSAPVRKR
jgi:hypothetical protein